MCAVLTSQCTRIGRGISSDLDRSWIARYFLFAVFAATAAHAAVEQRFLPLNFHLKSLYA